LAINSKELIAVTICGGSSGKMAKKETSRRLRKLDEPEVLNLPDPAVRVNDPDYLSPAPSK
jgi:hypothetical protein